MDDDDAIDFWNCRARRLYAEHRHKVAKNGSAGSDFALVKLAGELSVAFRRTPEFFDEEFYFDLLQAALKRVDWQGIAETLPSPDLNGFCRWEPSALTFVAPTPSGDRNEPGEATANDPSICGGCPLCGKNDGYLNIGPDHWFVCHAHEKKWCRGSNLFSSWRAENDDDWEQTRQDLAGYEEVDPVFGKAKRKLSVARRAVDRIARLFRRSDGDPTALPAVSKRRTVAAQVEGQTAKVDEGAR